MILFGKEKLNAYYKYFQYNMRTIFFAPQPVKRMCWVCSQGPSRTARSPDHTLQIQTTCNTTAESVLPHVRIDFFALYLIQIPTFLAMYDATLKLPNIANFMNFRKSIVLKNYLCILYSSRKDSRSNGTKELLL